MTDMAKIGLAVGHLELAVERFERDCKAAGSYMPGLATRLRIYADDLADRYPDDTNGGRDR